MSMSKVFMNIDQLIESFPDLTDFMLGKRAFYASIEYETLRNDDQRNGWKRQEVEYGAWLADQLEDEYDI
jgi:hypothetical protein